MPSVLVVAPTAQLAAALMTSLTEAGCEVTLVTSFAAGKAHLADTPSALISEVRLGDYNGLHLAIWAKADNIPAIVVGNADSVLQREAESLGVAYVTQLDRSNILNTIGRLARQAMTGLMGSATSNLSFMSWDALAPAAGEPDQPHSARTRRALQS